MTALFVLVLIAGGVSGLVGLVCLGMDTGEVWRRMWKVFAGVLVGLIVAVNMERGCGGYSEDYDGPEFRAR